MYRVKTAPIIVLKLLGQHLVHPCFVKTALLTLSPTFVTQLWTKSRNAYDLQRSGIHVSPLVTTFYLQTMLWSLDCLPHLATQLTKRRRQLNLKM